MGHYNRAGICLLAGDAALCFPGADQHMESDIPYAPAVLHRADGHFIAGVSDLYTKAEIP